jgi:hypothetical protein
VAEVIQKNNGRISWEVMAVLATVIETVSLRRTGL